VQEAGYATAQSIMDGGIEGLTAHGLDEETAQAVLEAAQAVRLEEEAAQAIRAEEEAAQAVRAEEEARAAEAAANDAQAVATPDTAEGAAAEEEEGRTPGEEAETEG
jgi:hypothetical protein